MKNFLARARIKLAFCVLVLLLTGMFSPGSLESAAITKNEQGEIVTKICRFLESNYVVPERGERVSTQLLASHERGEYAGLGSAKEFAARLDADLMEWSSDKHLGVVYDPDWVKQIREQCEEEDAYLTEEMVAEERARNFGFKRMEIMEGNVGYLDLRIFFHPKYAGESN